MVLVWGAVGALSQLVGAENCQALYEKDEQLWRGMSQAMSVYTPVKHRPEWYWKEVFERRGIEAPGSSGYEDAWLDILFSHAQNEVLGCQVHSGRYWEMVLNIRELFDVTHTWARPSLMTHVASAFNMEVPSARDQLPYVLRLCLCTPGICDAPDVARNIVPDFFAPEFMGSNPKSMIKDATFADVIEIEELQDWSSINLDFVIGGIDGCGTASLHMNLEKHADVAFVDSEPDYYFTNKLAHRLLPLKSHVEEYNAQVAAAADAKWKLTGRRPLVVGACIPALFSTGLARMKLAAIPKLKLVLIFCEPLGRMEKSFMHHRLCFDDLDAAEERGYATRLRDPSKKCFASTTALLTEKSGELEDFWENRAIHPHVPTLFALFQENLMVMHQEQLRINPSEVFDSLAVFLGAEAFPDAAKFARYNSIGGHRTDLCHNMTLVHELQQHLEEDYYVQERAMELRNANRSFLARLRRRRTRCHDIDRARVTYCPWRKLCE